jgi:asparagine synthase (glutamine-hydrolysing)
MLPLLAHRGPDDEGIFTDPEGEVTLGARRLSIIDVDGGHQPLSNEDGSVWAVLNGEIYNYPELRERLLERGHELTTTGDTEVLVHLYEDFGEDLVYALDGMFAFLIWDRRRGRLLGARDRFGEKPFFYSTTPAGFAVASELTALLAGLDTGLELDPAAVDAYFVFGYVPGPGSIDARVRQLSPGYRLMWDQARSVLEISPYWTPPANDAEALDHTDLIAEAEQLLDRSVRTRMRSDVPLGVFLSGGLDSSIVAALAARHSRHPVRTFTIGYDVERVNETSAARRVAQTIGSEHHEVRLAAAELPTRASRLMARLDQPLADPALVALHALAESARNEITVAVGGEGADELFGGYPRYRWLDRAEQLQRLVPTAAARGISGLVRGRTTTRSVRRVADVLAPVSAVERHLDWVTSDRRRVRNLVYGEALRRFVGQSVADLITLPQVDGGGSVAGRFMQLDQMHWLPYDVLAKADRATMLASLELRTPFLHRELAGLAASVPTHVHLRRGGKYVLRGVRARLGLPEQYGSHKQAFLVPVEEWIRGPLAPVMRHQLAHSTVYSEGLFDRDGVTFLLEQHVSGGVDRSAELWPIFTLASWLDARRGSS